MKIPTAETRLFGLLGYPVSHSLSPVFQNFVASLTGVNAVYLAFEVSPEDFEAVVNGFARAGVVGVNITVPHKERAYFLCDKLDEVSRLTGAVNTLRFKDGSIEGFNTDVMGFLQDVKRLKGLEKAVKKALVLGAGGAARAVVAAFLIDGWEVIVANRTLSRAEKLREDIISKFQEVRGEDVSAKIRVLPLTRLSSPGASADVGGTMIVNATSLGLKRDDPSPVSREVISRFSYAYDLIYHETEFKRIAREASLIVGDGLGMLVSQGLLSFGIWFGKEAPFEPVYSFLLGYVSYKARKR